MVHSDFKSEMFVGECAYNEKCVEKQMLPKMLSPRSVARTLVEVTQVRCLLVLFIILHMKREDCRAYGPGEIKTGH